MPESIRKYQSDLSKIQEPVPQDAISLIHKIDLERMLTEPGYILELSKQFVSEYVDEMLAASALGKDFGEGVIRNGRQDGN